MNTLRVILIIFLFAASLYGEDNKPDEHNKKTVTTNDETEKEQIETAIDVSIEETDTELEDLNYKEKENDDKIDKAKTSFANSSASNRKIIAGIGSIKKPKIISKKQTPAVISGTPPKRKKVQITTGKIPKSKPSQSIDLLKLKAKTQETQGNQQAARKFEDDVSDENEDSEVTASDIIKLIDNVDSLVRDKFNGDENKKENIANKKTKLTSIDNNKNVSSSVKQKERSTLSIKRSNDTRSDESTPLHNDEEQRNDGDTVNSNDVLSILETLRIDDNSEIQFFDDGDQNGGKKNETSQTNNKDTAITSKSPESNKNIQSENDDEHQVLPIVEKEIHNYKIDDEISIFDRKKKEKLVEPVHSKDDLIDDDFSRKQHENETSTEVVKNKVDNESNDGQKVETESEKTTKTVQHKENNDEYSVERKKDSKLLEEIPGQDNNKNGAIKIKKQESEKAKEVNDNDRHMDFNVKIMKPKIKTSTESVEDDDENGNVKKKREDSVKLTIDVDVKDKINDKVAVKIGQENKTETVISEDTDDDAGGQIKESEKTSSGVEEKKTHKDRNVKVKQQKNKAIDSVDDDNDNANAFENATTSADRSVKIKQEREESVEIALSKDNRKYTLRNHMRHNATEIAEDTSDKENGKTSDENVGDNNAETVEIKVQENKTSTGSTEDTDDNVERKNQGSGKETKDIHDMFDNEKEPFKIIKEQNAKALKSVQDKEKVGEVAHDDKIELLSDTSKRKSIKRKKAQLSLYSSTDDDDGNENEDLEQTTDEETLDLNVKKPLITVKDIHNTASDVVDMSMEESVKSRRLLAQLNETDDDTDGGEVSELVEQSVNTFVSSNATFEETATDMPQTTIYPIVSSCSSSPCVYASSCEDRTRDYYCVCQAFYTGKQCDVLIDPCTTTPCPFGASCISNSTDYVCVCPDGFKGQRCEKIDTLVVCKDALYKKDLSTDTIINCTRRLDTTPYDLCYDPDNNITFTFDDSTNGAIFGYNKHEFACLEANRSRVLLPKYCVNITATENDDKIYRPWRNATAKVCVIFNEPPQFTPTKLVTVNIRKATVGQPITDVNAVDNFVYSPVFKIIDVKPPEYLSCFSITFKGNISLAKIPSSITSGGQSVSIVVAVNDGGIPPLEATTTVTVTLVDIDLLCNFPREIYFGISSNTTILEDKIICTGATLLQYKLINSSGFPLMLGSNGSMVVMNIGLAPGSYEISVQVSSADNLASAFVNFTLHVGFYEPTCIRYSPVIQIHISTPVGTCYPAFYCNETINSDIVCEDFVAGALDTYLSSKCNITVSKSIIHLCVVQKLKLFDRQYEVQQEIRNTYGTTTPKISVNIYNKPPKILNLPLSANVSESSSIGVLVMTIVVEDDYERPVVEIIGSNYPFTLNSTSGEVKISRQLDFETIRLYNLPIQVTDSEGLITTAVATINIIDTNENPLCSPGEYTTNINATTKVGSLILTVICTDLDLNDKLIYQINNSSQDVLDVFTIIQDTGVITLKRQPPPGKVYYQFKVIITDKGGLTANVPVKVNFTFFPPNCGNGMLALEVQIKEDSGQNSCIPIVTNCVDPHGGKVNYTKASNTSLFDVYGADNGSLILCNAKNLQWLIRTEEFQVNAVNDVGRTPFNITVAILDVNSKPFFADLRNFTLSEKQVPGGLIGTVTALDNDTDIAFVTLTYSIDSTQSTFTISPYSGEIRLAQVLNATVLSKYSLTIKVTDNGGLFNTGVVFITVRDENEPPVCKNPMNIIQASLDLTTPVGTVIASLECWDYDKEDLYKTIIYNITGDSAGIFSVNGNGKIKVEKPIPRDSKSFRFQVSVADVIMVQTGNLTQRTMLDISVAVNTNFPPRCEKVVSNIKVEETKIIGDCLQEISCQDETLGNVTIVTVVGSADNYFEVKSRASETQGQLPLNLCIKKNIKNLIGTYQLMATVTNGLGMTTVTWNIEIVDVNEPPYFLNTPYTRSVVEYQTVSSSVLQVEWADPDVKLEYRTVNITSRVMDPADAADNINFYPNTNTYYISKIQNATKQSMYWFEVTATDGGGLSAKTNVTVEITDINESPICPVRTILTTIYLLTPVGETILRLGCFDTDKEANNRNISYSFKSPTSYFGVSSAGEIRINSPLPRYQNRYDFTVVVKDGGNPPLSTEVTVTVYVNTTVSAECSSTVDYPAVWVKDACVKLNMSCTDPSMPDTTHLQYTPSGTYTSAFTLATVSQGMFQLCYNLLTDSTTKLTIVVSNGLSDYRYNLDLEVKYSASTPQFGQSKYLQTVNENVAVGSSVVQVSATANGGGSIQYSILGTSTVFRIDPNNGTITSILSLRPLSDQTVTIKVQALNLMSQLKSTVDVEIIVFDVNEPPVCQLGIPLIPIISVDVPIETVLQNVTCTDPDVKVENKKLNYSIAGTPDITNVFKMVTVSNGGVYVATKMLLPITVPKYLINITARDNGQPPKEVVLSFNASINLKPPVPFLEVAPVNTTTVIVTWYYKRVDYYNVTLQFILKLNDISLDLPVNEDQRQSFIINLNPDTQYRVYLTAKTNYGNVSTPVIVVRTPAVPVLSTFVASMKITDETFDTQYLDPQSYKYVTLKEKVIKNLKFVLDRVPGFVSGSVLLFRRGSVIVDTLVTVNQTGTVTDVSSALQQTVSSGFLGAISVDPSYIIIANGDGYVRVTGISIIGKMYEGNSVNFTCLADIIGNVGAVTAMWKLNDAVINPTSNSRWKNQTLEYDSQSPGTRQYQLTVNQLTTGDSGNISCHLSAANLYSDWRIVVEVIGKPVVLISPMTLTVHQGDTVNVDCRLDNVYPNVITTITWYKNGVEFLGSQDEIINQINMMTHHVLTISKIQDTVGYECMARNSAGEGERASCNITVIKAGISYKYCSTNMDSFGTKWNSTVDGTLVVIPCIGEYTGTVSRFCTKDGIWEESDYSNCVRIDLQIVNKQSDDLKNGVEVANVDKILRTLNNLTSDSNGDLRSGDLEVSSSTLDNVADHAKERMNSLSDIQLEEFVSSCNNLLSEKNTPSWEQLKRQNLIGVSRVVKAVTTYSKAYTKYDNKEFSMVVEKENLVVQVGKVQSEGVTFPDRSKKIPEWMADSTTSVKLNKATLNGQGPVGYSSAYYRNISKLFHQYLLSDGDLKAINGSYDVNSVIVDFSISPAPAKLNPPLVVEFQHLSVNYSKPVCGFWDFSVPNTPNGAWSTKGARTVHSSDTSTTCEYDHTTNFAVLMSPGKTPPADVVVLSIISSVGCAISLVFLLITVVIYIVLWRYLKSDRSTILVNLCISLIISYVIFLAGVAQTENQDVCKAVAVLLHYIFLVDFFLMLAEGIEVAFCVLYVFSTRSRVHWLVPACWIVPLIIVAISMGVTRLNGYGNSEFCWLSLETGLLWAFVGPALLIILINLIILILVLKTMFSSHSMMTKSAKQQAKTGIRSICVILPLFGVTWVFGVFSVNEELVAFQYLFAIFNSLQGFFIFLLHCFFNRQVREGFQHSQRRKKSARMDYSKSTSHSTHTKNLTRESNSNIHNNLEEELKNSKNPFLQADNQVQQIVGKFLKTDDGKGNNLQKDNIINIDDIKISNIMREAEINDPPSRKQETAGTRTSSSSSDKKASKSSLEKSSVGSREPGGLKTSSSSSRTKTSATTQSTDLDVRHSNRSDEDFERKSRRNNKAKSSNYSPKQQRKYFEPAPIQKKKASHWGKVKQAAASKKHRSREDERTREKDRHRRNRHHDRSGAYAVEYYDNPVHHRSMEDMTMQYMGYPQPFVRTYEPLRTPRGYHHPADVPWYEVPRPDYC